MSGPARSMVTSMWVTERTSESCQSFPSGPLLLFFEGGLHFVFGAFPQHILLHFPNNLCHFPNNFASFPQQFCFISPTICFTSPTIWFISPTIWVISPNHFLISPTILCQFAPQINLNFFWENVQFLKCGSFLAPTLHLPQWISQSVSPKGALCVSQSIIIQKQLLFEIVTHPNISSQADLDKSLDLKNLLKRNECSCLVLLSIFKMLRKHFKFVPCFSSCEKLHFWRSEVSSPPPPFSTLGEIFRMKDEILKLRPMGVDGCLMTGAIQDHFVGFRLMTILAGQSYISEVNIFCCDVKAEEQIINYLWLILLSTLRDFLLLLQYSLSPLEIVERCLRLFFLLSKLSKEQYFSLFESWENFVWFLFLFSRKEIHISLSPLKNGEIVFKFLSLSVE